MYDHFSILTSLVCCTLFLFFTLPYLVARGDLSSSGDLWLRWTFAISVSYLCVIYSAVHGGPPTMALFLVVFFSLPFFLFCIVLNSDRYFSDHVYNLSDPISTTI